MWEKMITLTYRKRKLSRFLKSLEKIETVGASTEYKCSKEQLERIIGDIPSYHVVVLIFFHDVASATYNVKEEKLTVTPIT